MKRKSWTILCPRQPVSPEVEFLKIQPQPVILIPLTLNYKVDMGGRESHPPKIRGARFLPGCPECLFLERKPLTIPEP